MYGTRKELTRELKDAFVADEPLALLVWTTESIKSWLRAHGITESEAAEVLIGIGNLPMRDHQSDGVSFDTIANLLNGVRSQSRPINVPADVLMPLSESAERALKTIREMETDCELPASDYVDGAFADVALLRELLAA
ncbi:DUF1380 family protein [Lelliottia sp. JS-SCA-14]|uniref:DUF1380 family protein n=1 Tax=Lelliottia sp. JS-SCA-14 TaxID=3110110 RepID=UPI002D77B60B|nr:DUF1380 family protein [Lelliottia sp. JS-SCA-14]